MSNQRGYLYEIQGLRAVAALMVSIYHIWIQKVSGGVDVFFVVAAFFIIGSLLKQGPLRFHDVLVYYSKTLRRVVPSAVAVIVATIVLSLFFMPDSMWRNQIKHAFASTIFMENWALALSHTSYLQQGAPPSPFQQLWALAVQVQYYFLFPLILWIGGRFDTRKGTHNHRSSIVALALITVVSLGYSIYITAHNQSWAYFDTAARAWEFSFGGLLAFLVSRITVSHRVAKVMGWVSLIVLLTFAMFLNVSKLFPGIVAMIPVLAATGIIIAARNRCDIKLLNNRVVVWFGNISFAYYLWHWPLLSFYRYLTGQFDVGFVPGLVIIVSSGILAFLTTWGFEDRIRRSRLLSHRHVYSYVVCFALLVLPMASLTVWYHNYQERKAVAEAELDKFMQAAQGENDEIYPATLIASMDLPPSSSDGCHQNPTNPNLVECVYGDKHADETVVLAGGSHAQQWLEALKRIAQKESFKLVTLTKGGCMLSLDPDASYMKYASCYEWNKKAIARILEIKPDLVFTNATRGQGSEENVPKGYLESWAALDRGGINVLALRDNPWYGFDVPECMDLHGDSVDACSVSRDKVLSDRSPTRAYHLENVHFTDISDVFCNEDRCRPLKGNVLVYRDDHHITNTFSRVEMPRIEKELDAAMADFQAREMAKREQQTGEQRVQASQADATNEGAERS